MRILNAILAGVAVLLLLNAALAQSADESLDAPIDTTGMNLDPRYFSRDSLALPDSLSLMHLSDSLLGGNSDELNTLLNLARQYMGSGKLEDALAGFSKVVQSHPGDAAAWAGKGEALSKLGQYPAAVGALDQAIELDPSLAGAHYNRAAARNMMDQPEAALQDLQAAFASDPKLKNLAKTSEFFKSLNTNPKFQKLVK
jgi:tetratricopeptide (TPR) repeat protein